MQGEATRMGYRRLPFAVRIWPVVDSESMGLLPISVNFFRFRMFTNADRRHQLSVEHLKMKCESAKGKAVHGRRDKARVHGETLSGNYLNYI